MRDEVSSWGAATETGPSEGRIEGSAAIAGALSRRPDALMRMIVALVAEEAGRLRARSIPSSEWALWDGATRLDEDGIGLDSLARLEVVARVTRAFALNRASVEDYLVVRETLGEWLEVVRTGLDAMPAGVCPFCFETSGSTGTPRRFTHDLASLAEEVRLQPAIGTGTKRIAALVPPHHLYGFLFTVLAPTLTGLEVRDLRTRDPGAVSATLAPGDLLVATPHLLELALAGSSGLGEGISVVLSGSPSDAELWQRARAAGAARIVEIYGATEIAGVGWRESCDAPFRILPHLRMRPDGALVGPDGETLPELPDAVEPCGPGLFRLAGRRDGAVQVAGVNVFPERVAAILEAHPAVRAAAVRADGVSSRLKAFVVPCTDAQGLDEADLRRFVAEQLAAPERPARYRFGAALPLGQMGKPADWD